MLLINAQSHYISPPTPPTPQGASIVEVKDACVGEAASPSTSSSTSEETAAAAKQFKRALLRRFLRQTVETTGFLDSLLSKDPGLGSWGSQTVYPQQVPPQTRMPFGAKVENGLIREDIFVRQDGSTTTMGGYYGYGNMGQQWGYTSVVSKNNNNSGGVSGQSPHVYPRMV